MTNKEKRAGPDFPNSPKKNKPKYSLKQKIDCKDCLYFNRKERRCIFGEENCILISGVSAKNHERYAGDKPKECRYCYWWDRASWSCSRVVLGGCAYEIWIPALIPEEPVPSGENISDAALASGYPCRTCSYSLNHSGAPCVSFCMKNLLEEWNAERRKRQM